MNLLKNNMKMFVINKTEIFVKLQKKPESKYIYILEKKKKQLLIKMNN